MKKLIALFVVIITISFTFDLNGQSLRRLNNNVNRLTEDVAEQRELVNEKQEELDAAERAVEEEIERLEEEGRANPRAHGPHQRLADLRAEAATARSELDAAREELEELEEELESAKEALDEKLEEAKEDILEDNPIPDNLEDLDEFEREIQELVLRPRNREVEQMLRDLIQEEIDAARAELTDKTALPNKSSQNFLPAGTPDPMWETVSHTDNNSSGTWAAGIAAGITNTAEFLWQPEAFDVINEAIYSDEKTFEKLFDYFGGEFFIGTFSAPPTFESESPTPVFYFGVQSEYWLNHSFGVEMVFRYNQAEAAAEFPITAISSEDGQSTTYTGTVSKNIRQYQGFLNGKFQIGSGTFRQVFSAGIGLCQSKGDATHVTIGSEAMQLEDAFKSMDFGGQVSGGVRISLNDNIVLEPNATIVYFEEVNYAAGCKIQFLIQ